MILDLEKAIVTKLKTLASGTIDETKVSSLCDADGNLSADMVGATAYNTTDSTSAIITAFVDSGELTLASDIFVITETYRISFFNDGYVFDPDRKLDAMTRPFFVVKVMDMTSEALSFIAATATAGTDRLTSEDYLIWIYVYPRNDLIEMRRLPEDVKVTLYKNLTVSGSVYRIENIHVEYVGSDNEADILTKRLSVVSGILTHYRQVV